MFLNLFSKKKVHELQVLPRQVNTFFLRFRKPPRNERIQSPMQRAIYITLLSSGSLMKERGVLNFAILKLVELFRQCDRWGILFSQREISHALLSVQEQDLLRYIFKFEPWRIAILRQRLILFLVYDIRRISSIKTNSEKFLMHIRILHLLNFSVNECL